MRIARYLSLTSLLLTGCASIVSPDAPSSHAVVILRPELRRTGFQTQSGGYAQADVNHLQIKLFKLVASSEQAIAGEGGAPLMLDLPQASLSMPVTFSNLNYDTQYRIRAYAYKASGTAAGDLISIDSGSYLDLTMDRNDRPELANLPVLLGGGGAETAAATISTGVTLSFGGLTYSGSPNPLTTFMVSLLAGSGVAGNVNGYSTTAQFNAPSDGAFDLVGNLYVSDTGNNLLRKLSTRGTSPSSTFAGDTAGASGSLDDTGTAARFNAPRGVAFDGADALYVADTGNHVIRKVVISTGGVSTLCGTAGATGSVDGTGATARFWNPTGLAFDPGGLLYVADASNNSIRQIVLSTKQVTTVSGSTTGIAGSADGQGTASRYNSPEGLAYDGLGNLYVADTGNHTIRKVVIETGDSTTLAGAAGQSGSTDDVGSAARFNAPARLAVDVGGNLLVSDTRNHTLRRVVASTAAVSTLAGQVGAAGMVFGHAADACFNSPTGLIAVPSGLVYVVDTQNHCVRTLH